MYRGFGISDIGIERSNNEDSFLINGIISREKSIYFECENVFAAIADGMGGAASGEIASNYVLDKLKDNSAIVKKENIGDIINDINLNLFEEGKSIEDSKGMGSTLCGVLFNDESKIIFNVGDSRCYLFRNNILLQMTKDQTLAQEFYEHGIIAKEQIKDHPRSNILTQCMGGDEKSDVTAEVIELNNVLNGDIIIICSDGLHNKLNDSIIKEILNKEDTLKNKCTNLIKQSNILGGEDNITVILIQKI